MSYIVRYEGKTEPFVADFSGWLDSDAGAATQICSGNTPLLTSSYNFLHSTATAHR